MRNARWLPLCVRCAIRSGGAARAAAILVAAAGAIASGQALAQGSTEPGQVERRVIPVPVPAPAPLAPVAPARPAPEALEAPEGRFVLSAVEVEGSTVFSRAEIARLYEGYLGKPVSSGDIAAIVAAITGLYRDEGYAFSRAVAPPQEIKLGILRVRVIEGYVEEVAFSGDAPGYRSRLESYAEKIRHSRPLRLDDLERYLLLIKDLPGVRAVRPLMQQSGPAEGAYALQIDIRHDAVEGYAGLNNRGTTAIGPLQALAGVQFNSLLGLYDRSRLIAFTVPDDPQELIYGEFFEELFVGSEGTRLSFAASRSRLDTDQDLTGVPVEGQSERLSFGLSHPVIRTRDLSLILGARFDATRSEQEQPGFGFDERLRVVRLSARVVYQDSWDGVSGFGVEVSRGLDGLGASDEETASLSRFGGDTDFTKVAVDFQRHQALFEHWFARLSAAGQWSPYTLLSSEEFVLGGAVFGRAFDPSELAATSGAAGALELGYRGEPDLPVLRSYEVYGFGDGGAVWASSGISRGLASAGVGFRLEPFRDVRVQVEYAWPLIKDVTLEGDRDPRLFFSVSAAF